MDKDKGPCDSSDEGVSGSDDEILLLTAVNRIVTRSLKRSRAQSKMDNPKRRFFYAQKVVRDRRQGRQVVDKDVSIAKSRYNHNYLIKVLKNIDDDQRKHLKDIGFGCLLELDCGVLPWSFVQWLAANIDVGNAELTFDHKSIPISPESFAHVLGISASGNPVPAETKTSTAEFLQLFGLIDLPSVKYFGDKIVGGDWIRMSL